MKAISLKTAAATSFAVLLSLSCSQNVAPAVSEVLIPLPVAPVNAGSVLVNLEDAMRSLESTYGITIGRAGQKAGFNFIDARYHIQCRQPSQLELTCLQEAIKKSGSAHRGRGRTGIAIYFLTDPLCCGVLADWALDQNNRPAIFVEAAAKSNELEYIFLHELAHNSAYRMGFDPSCSENWHLSSKLGWTKFRNPDTNETGWFINLKDGTTYKKSSVSNDWVRVNGRGQPLNPAGVRVKRQIDAERCSRMEIMKQARVTPISSYFPTPMEVYAEGMAHYRQSEEKRALLKWHSPELFKIIEHEQQRESRKN